MYNLDGEDEIELTHGGRALSSLGYLEESDSDSEQNHFSDAEEEEFGGFTKVETPEGQDPEDRYKSKSDVMKEVISKSKYYRYMTQKEQEERMELTSQLDKEFDEIRDLLEFQTKKEEEEVVEEKDKDEENVESSKDADYDRLAKLLSRPGIKKAMPSDPLKDEEERQRIKEEQLKKLEEERLARMEGKEVAKKEVRFSADDLDDYSTRQWLPDGHELGDDEDEYPESQNKRRKFDDDEDERPSKVRPLKESKKVSLRERYGQLVDEIIEKASDILQVKTDDEVKNIIADCHMLSIEVYDIASQIKDDLVKVSRDSVKELHKSFIEQLDQGSDSVVLPLSGIFIAQLLGNVWSITDRRHHVLSPLIISLGSMISLSKIQSKQDMVLYQLLLNLFYNNVEGPKRSSTEAINAIITLLTRFVTANDQKIEIQNLKLSPLLAVNDSLFKVSSIKTLKTSKDIIKPLSLLVLSEEDEEVSDVLKLQFVHTLLNLLTQYMSLYEDEVGFIDLFELTSGIVTKVSKVFNLPTALKGKCNNYTKKATAIIKSLKSKRYALQQFAKKPESISLLTPDFQERYFGTKVSETKAKRDEKKLRKKYKSEQRGAEKELRKDSQFIADIKLKKQVKADNLRNQRTKDAFKFFENQQREANEHQRNKKRKSLSGL